MGSVRYKKYDCRPGGLGAGGIHRLDLDNVLAKRISGAGFRKSAVPHIGDGVAVLVGGGCRNGHRRAGAYAVARG
ncbi:hypothetical protein SDC9_98595 [bioreactor metagenome]|uniref:Uncharacterized protein n=1 Tax=bioreactor metagenome TaxID=1076179 RepID=A0A645AQG8_9ZZZZ